MLERQDDKTTRRRRLLHYMQVGDGGERGREWIELNWIEWGKRWYDIMSTTTTKQFTSTYVNTVNLQHSTAQYYFVVCMGRRRRRRRSVSQVGRQYQ